MTNELAPNVNAEPGPNEPLFSDEEIAELDRLKAVYLEAQSAYRQAKHSYCVAEREYEKLALALHARIPNPAVLPETVATQPKPERLFDVWFVPPKHKVIRLLATDKEDAGDLACEFFDNSLSIKAPDATKRPVFAWRPPKSGIGHYGLQRAKAPKQLTSGTAVASS